HNTGNLEVVNLDGGGLGFGILNTAAVSGPSNGHVRVEAESDIVVNSPISSVGTVSLLADGQPGSTIYLNNTISATGGASSIIDLFARDSIVVDNTIPATLITGGRIILQA